ncbi:MAG: Ig-like domain-containing protein [Thermoguttaceae bacterium]
MVLRKLGQSRRTARRGKVSSRLRHGGRRALSLESLEERSLLSVAPTVASLAPASAGGSVVAGPHTVNAVKASLLNAPLTPTIGLDPTTVPPSDSGFSSDPGTFADNITNDTVPGFTGTATAGDTINVYVTTDFGGGDQLVGTATADATGAWSAAWNSVVSGLNDAGYFSAVDGARFLYATDVTASPNVSSTTLEIFVDTGGPQVNSVTLQPSGQDAFATTPTLPAAANRSVNEIDIQFIDQAVRDTTFQKYYALNNVSDRVLSNYSLIGASSGPVAISSVLPYGSLNLLNQGITDVQLYLPAGFTLKDDTYTLTVYDSLVNDAGNALDGETTLATQPAADTIVLPSGDSFPGGNFSAQFTVSLGTQLAVNIPQGTQFYDPINGADPSAAVTAPPVPGSYPSDVVFAGKFAGPDAFSDLAAYGKVGGQYQFLMYGAWSPLPAGTPQVNGLPVAGSFLGNTQVGDDVGLFDGSNWYLFTNGPTSTPLTVAWPKADVGLPVVGDFDGDGNTDLATWNYHTDTFYVSFAIDNYDPGLIQSFQIAGPVGSNARPVATDIDHDGYDDLGLWVPNYGAPSTQKPADWYFLESGTISLYGRTALSPFTVEHLQIGSSVGVPLAGNFSALAMGDPPAQVAPGMRPNGTVPAAGSTLMLTGSAANDTFNLAPGKAAGTWTLLVDGVAHTIGANVTSLNLDGLKGSNTLSITGTGKGETAKLWSDHMLFQSGKLTVTAKNVTNISVTGGGNDKVTMQDTVGGAALSVKAGLATLAGKGFALQARGFASVSADAKPGAKDTAALYESSSKGLVTNPVPAIVALKDAGLLAGTEFFGKVQILSPAGAVVKTYVPTKRTGVLKSPPPAILAGSKVANAPPASGPAATASAASSKATLGAALLAVVGPGTTQKSTAAPSAKTVDLAMLTYVK